MVAAISRYRSLLAGAVVVCRSLLLLVTRFVEEEMAETGLSWTSKFQEFWVPTHGAGSVRFVRAAENQSLPIHHLLDFLPLFLPLITVMREDCTVPTRTELRPSRLRQFRHIEAIA